jgi:hypothetical protein
MPPKLRGGLVRNLVEFYLQDASVTSSLGMAGGRKRDSSPVAVGFSSARRTGVGVPTM